MSRGVKKYCSPVVFEEQLSKNIAPPFHKQLYRYQGVGEMNPVPTFAASYQHANEEILPCFMHVYAKNSHKILNKRGLQQNNYSNRLEGHANYAFHSSFAKAADPNSKAMISQ